MKTKQQTINISMFILLFLILIQQAFRLVKLNLGLYTNILIDVKFFIVLTVISIILYSLLYLLSLVFIISIKININIYMPVKLQYFRNNVIVVSKYKKNVSYQELAVIRC